MYIVDFSDKTIRYINFKKSLLGKFEVQECGIVDTQENGWEEQLRSIVKNQKIALVIPESISRIVRFQAAKDIAEETLKAEVEQQIAQGERIDEFAFDCGIKKKDEGASDVMCLAAGYRDLAPIFSLVQACDAKPTLAVPESLAVFRILRDGIIEGEVVLLIDIENDGTHFIFYDSTGPIQKISSKTDLNILDKTTQKAIEEFTQDKRVQINRIVLNGELASQIEPFEFRKSVNTLTIKAEDILKDRLSKLNLSFECGGENVGRYLNAIATGLLDQDTSTLNLVKNDVLMNVEKYAMAHKDDIDAPRDVPELSSTESEEPKKPEISTPEKKEGRPRLTAEPLDEEEAQDEPETKEEARFERKEPMSHTIGSPDSQFRSSFRSDDAKSGGGAKKKIFLFILVALLVAVVAGIALYMLGGDATIPQSNQTVPTQAPLPSPTPTPELEREDLTLEVLNGSGEAGVAGDVAAALEDLGYAGGIDTGNADSYDYEETVIQLKPEFEDYFDMLKDDLESEGYAIGNDFEELDEEADTDGVVIVGSLNEDQAEEAEDEEETTEEEEPTPTPEEE